MTTEMERAFYASDTAWDGRFVAAVRTTGIFCRPSCRVRKPLPKNVEYLPDAAAARAAGYRACLRCHPERGTRVTLRTIETPIGPMLAGATDEAIVLCDFAERPMIGAQLAAVRRRIGPTLGGRLTLARPARVPAGRVLRRHAPGLRPAASTSPAAHSRSVSGRSSGASRMAKRSAIASSPSASAPVPAYRAVGRANGSNRVAVVVPCHRVIAAGGGLGGYGGGLAAKRRLLELEAAATSG